MGGNRNLTYRRVFQRWIHLLAFRESSERAAADQRSSSLMESTEKDVKNSVLAFKSSWRKSWSPRKTLRLHSACAQQSICTREHMFKVSWLGRTIFLSSGGEIVFAQISTRWSTNGRNERHVFPFRLRCWSLSLASRLQEQFRYMEQAAIPSIDLSARYPRARPKLNAIGHVHDPFWTLSINCAIRGQFAT